MDDYISKPIKPEVLAAVLKRWIADPGAQRDSSNQDTTGSIAKEAMIDSLAAFGANSKEDKLEAIELIGLFIRDTRPSVATLGKAIAEGNRQVMQRIAHGLKGSSDLLGLHHLAALSAELEEKSRNNSLLGAEIIEKQLEDEFERVRQSFEAERAFWLHQQQESNVKSPELANKHHGS
jgi:HPt (histidine-containing phosphotransfer) domain-containing protein